MSLVRSAAFAALMALALVSSLQAQNEGLRIRAARRDSITAAATVTAAFAVSNARDDTAHVMAHVELPKDWVMLMGGAPFDVAPRSTEMLMFSAVVPARAAAGAYAVRMWITTPQDPRGVADSVVVVVPPRRAV